MFLHFRPESLATNGSAWNYGMERAKPCRQLKTKLRFRVSKGTNWSWKPLADGGLMHRSLFAFHSQPNPPEKRMTLSETQEKPDKVSYKIKSSDMKMTIPINPFFATLNGDSEYCVRSWWMNVHLRSSHRTWSAINRLVQIWNANFNQIYGFCCPWTLCAPCLQHYLLHRLTDLWRRRQHRDVL